MGKLNQINTNNSNNEKNKSKLSSVARVIQNTLHDTVGILDNEPSEIERLYSLDMQLAEMLNLSPKQKNEIEREYFKMSMNGQLSRMDYALAA